MNKRTRLSKNLILSHFSTSMNGHRRDGRPTLYREMAESIQDLEDFKPTLAVVRRQFINLERAGLLRETSRDCFDFTPEGFAAYQRVTA